MTNPLPLRIFIALFYLALSVPAAAEDTPLLSMPLACTVGETCFIQTYVDADSSPAYRDYHCGALSYDDHRGTDFRLKSMADLNAGVPVLAAADGVVRAVHDGMEDISVQILGKQALQGREAGNSVVIVHSKDWESQYAHLKKGSVAVQPGQTVKRGTVLGRVGLSGNSEFLHLHFEIRHKDKPVDPFVGLTAGDTCSLGKRPLWQADTLKKLPYIATGLISAGFADHPSAPDEGLAVTLAADAPALVFAVTVFGVQTDDEQKLDFFTPDGAVLVHQDKRIEKNMAQYHSFIGKKRPPALWPKGNYRAVYQLLRKQQPIVNQAFSLRVGP